MFSVAARDKKHSHIPLPDWAWLRRAAAHRKRGQTHGFSESRFRLRQWAYWDAREMLSITACFGVKFLIGSSIANA